MAGAAASRTLTLRWGPWGLVVAPGAGGSIARFWSEAGGEVREWLRRAPPEALRRQDAWGMAAYPLVPWSNRIRDGRFPFGGRVVTLAPGHVPPPHALHGLGMRAAWTVEEAGPSAVRLAHRPVREAWPWAYRAEQRLALGEQGLTVELELVNESPEPMPAGLGWHPYFTRTPATTLTAQVSGMWRTDEDVLPVELGAPEPGRDPAAGLCVDRVALDNVFVGWGGRADIAWPEWGARLTLAATPPLRCLVVYTPPGRAFFCAEPVSHVTDAFNLAAAGRPDTGRLVLAPGQGVRAAITLGPGP